jgi:hypothetical protein
MGLGLGPRRGDLDPHPGHRDRAVTGAGAEWAVEKMQGIGLADFRICHLTDGEATTPANPGDQTVASFKPVRDIINDDPYLRAGPAGLDGSSFFVLTIKR